MVTAVKQVNTLLAGHPFRGVADDTLATSDVDFGEPTAVAPATAEAHAEQAHGQAAPVAAATPTGLDPLTVDLNTLHAAMNHPTASTHRHSACVILPYCHAQSALR